MKEFSKDMGLQTLVALLSIAAWLATVVAISSCRENADTTEARAQGALKFYSDKSAELEGYIRGARATGTLPSPMAGDGK